jgi:hypothetical protein
METVCTRVSGAVDIADATFSLVANCISSVLKEESQRSEKSALEQIMGLVHRADTVTVKSEGTRVLANAIKTLSADLSSTDQRRKAARRAAATPENANALAALIGRSKKYPMLINEAVVALSFLTAQERGGEFLSAFVRCRALMSS